MTNKQPKTRIKFLPIPIVAVTVICAIVLCWALLVWFAIDRSLLESMPTVGYIVCIIVFALLPILLFVCSARRYFSVVTIDETGMRSALFGKFFKLEMTWRETKIRYFLRFMPTLIICKNTSTKDIMKFFTGVPSRYNGAGWVRMDTKNALFVQLTKKRLDIINRYKNEPIIDIDLYLGDR